MQFESEPNLADIAAATPDKLALVMSDGSLQMTYRELNEHSDRLARQLAGLGVKFGDTVGILMENRASYAIALWAAQRSGLIYTPVNWHLTEGEAGYIIGDSGCKAILTSPEQADLVNRIVANLDSDLAVFVCDSSDAGPFALAGGSEAPLADYELCEGQMLAYSSGTSGKPKGIERELVKQPFGMPNAGDMMLRNFYEFSSDMTLLITAPLYHTAPGAWMAAAQRCGGTVVLMRSFEAAEAVEAISRYGVTHGWFVPTMFIRMLRLPDDVRASADLSSLKMAIHSAAPCPVDTKSAMMEWFGPKLYEFYAASEGNGFVAIGPEDWLAHPGSVGRSDTVRILDDDGKECPPGEVGQVYFTSALTTFRYRNDPAKSAEAITAKGWSTVGDMGYVDAEGWLFLTDRKSHMIISGGVNIYPQEAENVLATHEDVFDAAVIGIPHPEFGEEVFGVIQLNAGVDASEAKADELVAYCLDRLSKFKCPRRIDFVDELPRLPTGKLLKRQLRDRYAAAARQTA